MSVLTDALDRVLDRHIALETNLASVFLPGLSRRKILKMTENIPYQIPEEVIELYEWHNGSDSYDFFPCFEFESLEFAIERNHYKHDKDNENWLAIMNCDGKAQLVALLGDNNIAPIYCRDMELGIYQQCFDFLTTMIQTIAACFGEDIYWWYDSRIIRGQNYDRYCQIHKQYNLNSAPLYKIYFED